MCVAIGSQGLRDILRERGNPIELMEECDVKPLLQAALTTSQGCRLVDLDAEEVPDARITEGNQAQTRACCTD